jgi:sarcosine oxidase subunit alpha
MPFRTSKPASRVEFLHDGALLPAEAGESLAHALLAADRLVLARSPKLHRPRGPYCLRAACDGCLVRVDGRPNVMACRTRVLGGETVETQNVLGSRELDLLSATDFLFPHGIDAHRLLAGVAGASAVVTKLARRIAGLGRLPDAELETLKGRRREVEVLVIGGGNSGLSAARELGARATLLDDGLALGGKLALLDPPLAAARVSAARAAGAELLAEATAFGVYREPGAGDDRLSVLCSQAGRATLFRARRVVLATGCHDAVPTFGDADLPGVYSARAALALEIGGVALDERVVLAGTGPFTRALEQRLGDRVVARIEDPAVIERATGKLRLRGVLVHSSAGRARVSAGALAFEAPPSPAFELAVQAGGSLEFRRGRGYAPRLDDDGRAADGVYCAGSVTAREHLRAESLVAGISGRGD